MEVGNGPYGRRRCVPIKSGSVKGKYINGEVVPQEAQISCISPMPPIRRICPDAITRLVEEDQTTHVNTNYIIKSDDGAFLYIR